MVARLSAIAEEQAALHRVATLVASGAEPSQVFERVCVEVGAVLGVKSTNVTRFESDGTQTVLAGWSMPGAPVFPVSVGVPLDGDAAVAKVSRSGRAERVDDYAGMEGVLPGRVRAAGIASAVAAPIKVGGRLWGAMVASSGEPYSFPSDTESRVAGFAQLVAGALASADAREKLAASRARIVEAGYAERKRLERNLHDGAQQRLVSLALVLGEITTKLDSDPAAARGLLGAAREELALALEELRELGRGIHPSILGEHGLSSALEMLTARSPVMAEITALPRTRLPESIEAAVYYLVAEALTNVARHSAATHVTVAVTRFENRARAEIRDNGVGGARLGAGSGLRGLADRVEALGGRFVLRSRRGTGTLVIADMPLPRT